MFAKEGSDLCRVHQHMTEKTFDDVAVLPNLKRPSPMDISPLRAAVEETGSQHVRKPGLRQSGTQFFNDDGNNSHAHGISSGVGTMGSTQISGLSSGSANEMNMDNLQMMFQKLLRESEQRQQNHFQSIVDTSIDKRIQPLQDDVGKLQNTTEDLHNRVQKLENEDVAGTSATRKNDERMNEIVLGGFGGKSRDGAIAVAQTILNDIAGAEIIYDRIGQAPEIVPVKFQSDMQA